MKNFLAFLFVGILFSDLARAESKEVGNGGNEVGIEFLNSALTAIQIYGNFLAEHNETKKVDLLNLLKTADVLSVQHPLYVEKDGITQESTAVNFPKQNKILVNENRWKAISSEVIREALALHELLGLVGIEKTGDYHISRGYLDITGVICDEDLCDNRESREIQTDQIYCRIDNHRFPDKNGSYPFNCKGRSQQFSIACDLSVDPIEVGYGKLDVRGGKWIDSGSGGFLDYKTQINEGRILCEKE